MAAERSLAVITGVGARAAVGDHAVQVAASIRAGVSGFRAWPHAGDDDAHAAAFVDPDLGDGPWGEKALELLRDPVREALFTAGLWDQEAVAEWCRRGALRAFLGTPHPGREGGAPGRLVETVQELSEALLPAGIALPVEAYGLDQPAGAMALAQACEALQQGRLEVALVCGVDSLLDAAALQPLVEGGRVKTDAGRAGFIPGEAGACLVVETAAHARRRGAAALAHLEAVCLEREQKPAGPEAAVEVSALVRCLERARERGGPSRTFPCVVSDLDGERWRFLAWALAEARVPGLFAEGWQHWTPADAAGEVGAAFIPLAAVLAVRGFARGYAGPGAALIVASSERGERAAVALGPPGGRG